MERTISEQYQDNAKRAHAAYEAWSSILQTAIPYDGVFETHDGVMLDHDQILTALESAAKTFAFAALDGGQH